MKTFRFYLIASLMFFTYSFPVEAVTLYIGDRDGFGFGNANGYQGSDGKPAERTGDRTILDMGDLLPDQNGNGSVAHGSNDNFDLRSPTEKADTMNTGAKWTDVSLSTTYVNRPGLADNAIFVFNFTPPVIGHVDYGRDHYINLVYADYDSRPMTVVIDGKSVDLAGNDEGGADGYIWTAYATVSWNDMKDGKIVVDVKATKEPYVAFDYIVLNVTKITIPNPNPASWLNLLL